MAKMERSHVREVGLMPILVERKLFPIGEGGFAITLPKAWINYHHLKPGDKVEIVAREAAARGIPIRIGNPLALEASLASGAGQP